MKCRAPVISIVIYVHLVDRTNLQSFLCYFKDLNLDSNKYVQIAPRVMIIKNINVPKTGYNHKAQPSEGTDKRRAQEQINGKTQHHSCKNRHKKKHCNCNRSTALKRSAKINTACGEWGLKQVYTIARLILILMQFKRTNM